MKTTSIFKKTARHRRWWFAMANIFAMLFAITFQLAPSKGDAATSTPTAPTCTVAPCIAWVTPGQIIGFYPTQNAACEAIYLERKATTTSPGLNFYAWEVLPRSTGNLCFIRGVQGNADATVIYPLSEYKYPEAPSFAQDAPESCPIGNPTFPGTGTKVHFEHVYQANFADPLRFSLTYRSRSKAIVQTTGWTASYSRRIAVFSNAIVVVDDEGGALIHNDIGKPNEWRSVDARNVVIQTFDSAGQKTGWVAQNPADDRIETYNKEGQLLSIKQRNGWVTSMQYDTNRKLVSVTNQFGKRLVFGYDSAGRMASVTTPQGAITRYGYDSAGNLTSITLPDDNIKRFHYEDSRFARALTGITDESGTRVGTYAYDAQGRIAETKRADGADRFQFSYANGPLGQRTQVTDFSSGIAASRTYDFVAQGQYLRPAAVSAPCAQCGNTALSTQYDAQGNKTREVAHDGTITFYAYNAKGQEIERAVFPAQYKTSTTRPALGSASAVTSTWWSTTWNLPTYVAQPGRYSTYTYNANGMLTGYSTVATTDATGAAKFSPVKSGPVRATSYGYDANNFNTSVVELIDSVEKQRWTLAYDTLGGLSAITDVTGAQSATLSNDANGRLTYLSASNGAAASFAWNANGQMTAATLPDYNATFIYTAQKRLAEVRLSTGEWLRVTYNARGEPTEVLNSSGQVQTVSGLSQHWLQSNRPLNALQTLLAHSLAKGPQRLGDLLIKSAVAQVPVPPMPSSLLGGLAAAGGAAAGDTASREAGERPAAGRCCSGIPSDREIQQAFQRMLPFTLLQGAFGLIDVLAQDILTMKGRSDLNKRLQCPTEAYYQPKPPGCWEAHHIVAFAAALAEPARVILRNVGIDINSPANGVWMACDKHRRMHTDDYYRKVNNRLTNTSQDKPSIEAELAKIRTQLQSGTF